MPSTRRREAPSALAHRKLARRVATINPTTP
jgi:hypothetical protein